MGMLQRLLTLAVSVSLIGVLFAAAPTSVRANGYPRMAETWVARAATANDDVNGSVAGTSCSDPDYIAGPTAADVQLQIGANHTLAGGTLHICPGVYNLEGTVDLGGTTMTLSGTTAGSTVLDGGEVHRILYTSASLTVRGLILRNGHSETSGGAFAASSATVVRSVFESNDADEGGAILTNDLTVSDSTFTSNSAYNYGGAIEGWGDVVISRSVFTNNSAVSGGAIAAYGLNLKVSGSTFRSNSAGCAGGAIEATYAEITSSVFVQNSAACAGGAIESYVGSTFNANEGSIVVIGSTFEQNSTSGNGGAINAERTPNIQTSTFLTNHANLGGALYSPGSAIVRASSFSSNHATDQGGALWVGSAAINHTSFDNNTSGGVGGAVRLGWADISFSAFLHNSSQYGGAMYADGGSSSTIVRSSFTRNSATSQGGAIAVGSALIQRSAFMRNTAGLQGGALMVFSIAADDLAKMSSNTFSRNSARYGGAMSLGQCGGLIRTAKLRRVQAENLFTGNRATDQRRTHDIHVWSGC